MQHLQKTGGGVPVMVNHTSHGVRPPPCPPPRPSPPAARRSLALRVFQSTGSQNKEAGALGRISARSTPPPLTPCGEGLQKRPAPHSDGVRVPQLQTVMRPPPQRAV